MSIETDIKEIKEGIELTKQVHSDYKKSYSIKIERILIELERLSEIEYKYIQLCK